MRVRIIAIEIVKISVLSGLILIAIGCSSSGSKLAINTIPDSSLETLYGGCGWFYNPYCVSGGASCTHYVGCAADPLYSRCTVCEESMGTVCHDDYSYWPDPFGCSNPAANCAVLGYGYCAIGPCQIGGDYDPPYPSCGTYSKCND